MSQTAFIPNLFILGAAKSGTTSLHEILKQHPDICMSNPKEPFFFECEFEKGLSYYRDQYFKHYNGEKYIGESRHRNLYLPYVASRIKDINPEAKLIIILRNPVDRAFSHWWHLYSRNIEKLDFATAIDADLKRIKSDQFIDNEKSIEAYCSQADNVLYHRTYVDSGYYIEQIERFEALFEKRKILVLFTEDLEHDFDGLKKTLFEFLELTLDSSSNRNNLKLNTKKVKERPEWMSKIARLSGFSYMLSAKRKEKLLSIIQNETVLKKKYVAVLQLLKEHYKPFNERLAENTERDLSHWIN
jgi:hypothetical protein